MKIIDVRNRLTSIIEQFDSLLEDVTYTKLEGNATDLDGLKYELGKLQTGVIELLNYVTNNDPEIEKINNMSHVEMARLWLFASSGHKYFDMTQPYYEIFKKRFESLGGMTPEISKQIGWQSNTT